MTILRTVAIATAVVGVVLARTPAHACDSNYPWLCPPVPSVDPPAAAAQPENPTPSAAKGAPRYLAAASRAARAGDAGKASARASSARAEHAVQNGRKRAARSAGVRHWALRARHAKITAARTSKGDSAAKVTTESTAPAPKETRDSLSATATAGPTTSLKDAEPNARFAAVWAERSRGTAGPPLTRAEPVLAPIEPARGVAGPARESAEDADQPAEAPPASSVPVQSQSEVNELDLAAPDTAAASETGWLRGLFLAFGGVLALGSALRLFL